VGKGATHRLQVAIYEGAQNTGGIWAAAAKIGERARTRTRARTRARTEHQGFSWARTSLGSTTRGGILNQTVRYIPYIYVVQQQQQQQEKQKQKQRAFYGREVVERGEVVEDAVVVVVVVVASPIRIGAASKPLPFSRCPSRLDRGRRCWASRSSSSGNSSSKQHRQQGRVAGTAAKHSSKLYCMLCVGLYRDRKVLSSTQSSNASYSAICSKFPWIRAANTVGPLPYCSRSWRPGVCCQKSWRLMGC
jgi:hypothetical protein